MIINEVMNLAKFSELNGVASKDNDDALVAFLNLGMIELYTRFPIRIKEHLITILDGQILYDMPSDFMYHLKAYGEVPEDITQKYIELGINESNEPSSIFFPDWKSVQIPSTILGSYVSIVYVANPDTVTKVQALDGVSVLDLPKSLIDCLLSYIGYRAHLGVKSDFSSETNAHWKRFERNCKKAEDLGVAFPIDELNTDMRIFIRGFL
jgi:hypothetical protein